MPWVPEFDRVCEERAGKGRRVKRLSEVSSEGLMVGRPDRVGLCFGLEGQRRGREPGLSPIYKNPIIPSSLLPPNTITPYIYRHNHYQPQLVRLFARSKQINHTPLHQFTHSQHVGLWCVPSNPLPLSPVLARFRTMLMWLPSCRRISRRSPTGVWTKRRRRRLQ